MGKMPIPPNFYFAKIRLISDKAFIKSEPLFVKSKTLANYNTFSLYIMPSPIPPTRAPLKMSAKTMANCTKIIAVAIIICLRLKYDCF